ncbi:MAG TPA: restriction endonuclease subunit S [Saprospiraceae bacterium]|nr:restriction endonuclease subunit S [Saprospiraceae bacterium]
MSKDNKHALSKVKGLIPELRFPEFKNEGEWDKDSIDNQFDLQDGYPFSSFDFTKDKKDSTQVIRITDINNQNSNEEKVYLPNSKIKDLDISKHSVHSGDLLLSLTGAAGFNFFIWNTDSGFINQRTMKISPKKHDNKALKFLLEPLIHSKINSIGTGQNNNLSKDALRDIEFPFPKPNEQKKLSSFTTNLNDLIAAHSQKLKLLKIHKKGLMQNLIPQDGEKVPKFRFKEFEKDGEWKDNKLGQIAENLDSKRIPITSTQREKGNVPYYGASGIVDYVKDYIFNETLLCISEDGANLIDRNYPIAFTITGKTWVNNHAHVLKFENFDTQILVEKYINAINIEDFLTGLAQPKLNRGYLDIIPIPLPINPKEQQKIASCLSTLDALISAQAEKIEQLKLHKKGLMEGLFPKIKE